MIVVILVLCFTIMVSAVPVHPLFSQGDATQAQPGEATNQKPDAQTPALLSSEVEPPQPAVPQQPVPQGGPQFLPPTQHYTWYPLGGSPVIIPLQQSVHGSQPANQPTLPQQPLIFPPYRNFPLFLSPYMNQLFPPYGFQMIPESPLPQSSANPPPNSPETPSGAAPSGNAPQPMQQQQNLRIVYMLQQPMNSAVGSLSSEELEMAVKMGQLGVYLSNVLTNPPTGAVQPVNQAAGLTNPEQQGIVPTVGTSSGRVPHTEGMDSSKPQPNTNVVPVGLERPAQEAATVQTPVQPKLQPTQGNLV